MKDVDYAQPPWKIERPTEEYPESISITDRFCNEVCSIRLEDDARQRRTALANAQLIATASELLETLEVINRHVGHYATMQHAHSDAHKNFAKGRAVIAKAKEIGLLEALFAQDPK